MHHSNLCVVAGRRGGWLGPVARVWRAGVTAAGRIGRPIPAAPSSCYLVGRIARRWIGRWLRGLYSRHGRVAAVGTSGGIGQRSGRRLLGATVHRRLLTEGDDANLGDQAINKKRMLLSDKRK